MRCQKSPLWCRLTYGEEFSKIKPSSHMYDTKCIFSAHIMCMVHTPFNLLKLKTNYKKTFLIMLRARKLVQCATLLSR